MEGNGGDLEGHGRQDENQGEGRDRFGAALKGERDSFQGGFPAAEAVQEGGAIEKYGCGGRANE